MSIKESVRVHTPRQVISPLPPEGEYQGRIDYYYRKMTYKWPVTMRFAAVATFCSGAISFARKKSFIRMPLHMIVGTPILGTAMCFQEVYGIGTNYYLLKFSKKA